MPTMTVTMPETIPWETFLGSFRWEQGQHVAIVGYTGCGKTTLMRQILPLRRYVSVLATKPESPSLDEFEDSGYKRFKEWPAKILAVKVPRRLIWPSMGSLDDHATQERVIGESLAAMFKEKSWTICLDEAKWICDTLHQSTRVRTLLKQGRELNISMVIGDQRPVFLPRETWSQSTHLFFWSTNDVRDLINIGSIGGVDTRMLTAILRELAPHEFVYINSRTRKVARSMTPDPRELKGGN